MWYIARRVIFSRLLGATSKPAVSQASQRDRAEVLEGHLADIPAVPRNYRAVFSRPSYS